MTMATIMLIIIMMMTQASDCFEADPVQDARPDQPETRFPWDHQVFNINIINTINIINIIIMNVIITIITISIINIINIINIMNIIITIGIINIFNIIIIIISIISMNIINFINIIITTIILLTTLTSRDVASEMKLLLDAAGRLAPMLPEQVSALPSPALPPSPSTSSPTASSPPLPPPSSWYFVDQQRAELDLARRKLLETSRSFSNALKGYFKEPQWVIWTFTWMYLIYLHFTIHTYIWHMS